jgi:PAS domain S-box-containing protein
MNSAKIIPITFKTIPKPSHRTDFDDQSDQFYRSLYSDAIFEALWAESNYGMRLTDENGIILAVNKAFCNLFQMEEHELIGKPFTVIYSNTSELEHLIPTDRANFLTGTYQSIFDLHLTLRSGKTLEVETSTTCVVSDAGKSLLLTQFRDITEERKADFALQQSEMKYKKMFMNSIQPMFECSASGKIIDVNQSFLRLLGYRTFDEIRDFNISQDSYVNPEVHKDLVTILETRGYIRNIELQLKRKNGNIITVIENAHAIYNETGELIGIEGVLEDVTAEKRLEQKLHQSMETLEESKQKLSEMNAQKNKLLSILSHDLRSPFACILGYCDILINEKDTVTAQERLEFTRFIQDAAQDQLALVNNLLDITRIESGRINFEPKDVDLHRIVEKSFNSLIGLTKKKDIQLLNKVPLNTYTHGDSQLLLQLFSNLISNSLKFTPAGGGIFIELEKEDKDNWTIAVRDTGIGIPESDIPKLFKIDVKYTRNGLEGERGTGLGLPICHEIMQKHHGCITVESVQNKGTTFFLQLPKILIEQGRSILIVDDAQGIKVLHSKYIQRILPDIKIVHASDGEEAFDMAQSLKPVLIITDHDMPRVNGHELVKRLKSNASTQSIPIVCVTGHDSHAIHNELEALGVSTILIKPVSQEQFELVISKHRICSNQINKADYANN